MTERPVGEAPRTSCPTCGQDIDVDIEPAIRARIEREAAAALPDEAMTVGEAPRTEAQNLLDEARSRGAHDECMDILLFTLQESGYAIEREAAAAPPDLAPIREAVKILIQPDWNQHSQRIYLLLSGFLRREAAAAPPEPPRPNEESREQWLREYGRSQAARVAAPEGLPRPDLPDLLRDKEGRFLNPVTGQPVPSNWQENLERQYDRAAASALPLDPNLLAELAYADRPPLGKRPVPWPPRVRKDWQAWARRIVTRLSPSSALPLDVERLRLALQAHDFMEAAAWATQIKDTYARLSPSSGESE